MNTCKHIPTAHKPRQLNADYRWTMPKVTAFLDALAACRNVAEAARAVGMQGDAAPVQGDGGDPQDDVSTPKETPATLVSATTVTCSRAAHPNAAAGNATVRRTLYRS